MGNRAAEAVAPGVAVEVEVEEAAPEEVEVVAVGVRAEAVEAEIPEEEAGVEIPEEEVVVAMHQLLQRHRQVGEPRLPRLRGMMKEAMAEVEECCQVWILSARWPQPPAEVGGMFPLDPLLRQMQP